MDLQKEREAFENWWVDFHNGRQIACDYVEEDNSYAVGYANAQWVAWQAKAQAVPEGFVLVPKEPNKQFKNVLSRYLDELWMGDHGCDWDYFVDAKAIKPNEIWQFMIEAQEQAND